MDWSLTSVYFYHNLHLHSLMKQNFPFKSCIHVSRELRRTFHQMASLCVVTRCIISLVSSATKGRAKTI